MKRRGQFYLFILLLMLFPTYLIVASDTTDDRKVTWDVEGRISDSNGSPIVGAMVILKGTSQGVTSDIDGNFAIKVSSDRDVLVFSFLGYSSVELSVGTQTWFSVTLQEESLAVEQVIVTGYGNGIKKESITGSIANINAGKLSQSVGANVSTALAGKVAGVNFRMMDGQPGATTSISIRNMGSALFVIDGVQSTQGSFNNLDFNDIESISVLKDASAAIYGVQAANGVIVVTTKSGQKTGNSVNVNAYYGAQSWFRYPRPADTQTYIEGHIQSATITGSPGEFTMDDLNNYRNGTLRGFDWYDYVVRSSAPQAYISANASGGTDKINYYISLGGLDQKSVINNYGGFQRYNVQFNLDARINKRLKLGVRFNGRYEKTEHPAVPGDDVWAAIFAIWRNPPTNRPFANDNPDYPTMTSNTASTNFAILNYDRSGYLKDTYRVCQLSANIEYEIIEGLKLKGLTSYYLGNRWYDCQEYTYDLYGYDAVTDTYPVIYSLTNPFRQRIVGLQQQIMGQAQLTYDKVIGRHTISSVIASEIYHEINPGLDTWSRPQSNYINTIDFASLEKYTDNKNTELARAGFVARVNYNYADQYYIELAGRYDGSWKFRRGNRWAFLPSVSIGWRPSEEHFWKEGSISHWFNSLKIRASFGQLGYDNLSWFDTDENGNRILRTLAPFDYLSGYDYGVGGAVLDGKYQTGVQSKGIPTTTISWITVNMYDAGIDFGFLANRLSGSLDYFYNLRKGLVDRRYDQLIPSEVGFTLPPENLASEVYTGFDGNIAWADRVRDFRYSVGVNFTYSRHLTHHQYNPQFKNSWDEYVNSGWERYSNITWGYKSDGQFCSWEEIGNYPIDIDGKNNSTLRPGDIRYKDLNGDGLINDMDKRPIGYAEGMLPNLNFGLSLSLEWNGIDMSCDFTGGAFGTYHVDYEMSKPFWDGGNTAAFVLENQWRLSDIADPQSPLIPGEFPTALVGNSNHSNYWVSDFWYKNITYIKLRNFELGYTLPQRWMSKAGINKLRLYLFGQNLFSIDNMGVYDIDPEIANSTGIVYPTTRVIGTGINLSF
mgnify:FL=1